MVLILLATTGSNRMVLDSARSITPMITVMEYATQSMISVQETSIIFL